MVDQYSGKILKVQDPTNRKSAGQAVVDWQWPLHSGKAFGWTGRILTFLSGLACPVLFVTGFIRWRQKRSAKKPNFYIVKLGFQGRKYHPCLTKNISVKF